MEKTFKIGESTIAVKGLKTEIEQITEQFKKLLSIKSYVVEKNGILGGEERETMFYVMFGQNELRDPEAFEVKKAEFIKRYENKTLTFKNDIDAIRKEVKAIFDAHVHIKDNRQTEEQRQQEMIERNKIAKEHEEKREQERIKTDQEKEQLKKEYPYLTLTSQSGLSSRINATRNIRKELDKAFPSLVFSITSETFSGGDSIDIRWTDGATPEEVNKITRKYQEGHFNGMVDIYEYSDRAFCSLFGGAKYVHANRSITTNNFRKVAEELGYLDNFKVIDERTWEVTGIETSKSYTVRDEITRKAYETSFYVKPSNIEVSAEIERSSNGIRIQENKEHQGIEIVFDSKPSPEIISKLKANRFRWNNRTKVWYSKMNSSSKAFADSFIKVSAEETKINKGSDCKTDHLDDSENCSFIRENEVQRVYQCNLCKEFFYYPKSQETTENPEEGLETQAYQSFERNLQTESFREREY